MTNANDSIGYGVEGNFDEIHETHIMTHYIILSAGQYEGTLVATTPGARRLADLSYASLGAAMRDIARVIPGDTDAIYADMVAVEGSDGVYVYRDQDDADADDTGADALAVIEVGQ